MPPHLHHWHRYDPESRVDLTMTALSLPGGLFFFDPIAMEESEVLSLLARTEPLKAEAILLTNANHQRHSAWFAARLGLPILAHRDAAAEVGASRSFLDGDRLFDELEVVSLPGGALGESAFYCERDGGFWIVGDALINLPQTGFALLPSKYCLDQPQLRRSLLALCQRPARRLAFAHGPALEGDIPQLVTTLLQKEEGGKL